jgi:pimeloyl-ACP methyl ester carboxylesterase
MMANITLTDVEFKVNRLQLHAVQAGPENGKLVVLLHGFPEFWYGWRHQIEPLASAGYCILAPDQRGYNLSEKPRSVAAYRLEETAKDVSGLLDSLNRETAAIVGHDWGGGVAWWLAINDPERVERLAILNMPHPFVLQRTLLRNPNQVFRSLYAAFFQLPGLPEAILRNNDWELLVRTLQVSSRQGTFTGEDIEQYRRAWWKDGAMTSMLNWYRANLRFPPKFPEDIQVRVPTLIIWGAQDAALSRQMAPASANLCVDGRLIMFEDATHWVQHEEAKEVNALLLDFLG